jgi:cyanophycinase
LSAGLLLAIGGTEDRTRERSLLRTFVEAAGGRKSRLVVLAAPPEGPAAGGHYENVFYDLRAGHVEQLRIAAVGEGPEGAALDLLEKASGLFLTGGSLLRLAAALGGTPLGEAIRRRHAAGLVVAGLGSGAAVLAGRVLLETPRQPPRPAPGLGLVEGLVFDPSLRPRDRLDRLLAGLASLAPEGIDLVLGLDADTAAAVSADGQLLVLGSGAVTVAELPGPAGADGAAHGVGGRLPPATLGLRLDVLSPGCRYDLRRRRALPPAPAPGAVLAGR